jgi:hypothetical protein
LQLAELAGGASPPAEIKAAVSSAVLAGIAASDAACCKALGRTTARRTIAMPSSC